MRILILWAIGMWGVAGSSYGIALMFDQGGTPRNICLMGGLLFAVVGCCLAKAAWKDPGPQDGWP